MPAELFLDPRSLDPSKPIYGREQIRQHNEQRFEMELLDGIVFEDVERGLIAGFLDIRSDSWWARGHFPTRPMLPGVLALEAAGQLCSFHFHNSHHGLQMGLGGIDHVRFRRPIEPPTVLYLVAKIVAVRARFGKFEIQGIVDGQLAVEARFTGAAI